ncbi:MAG: DUF5946 family protein [Caldilineaceae bacterium]
MIERCVGCNAEVQVIDGPIHRYMTSAPGCWQRYGELLGVLYTRPTLQMAVVLCVDTYAVQHPGTPNPQAIQSVAVHLLNLYDYLVRGRPAGRPQELLSDRAFHSIAPPSSRASFWLEPPSFAASRTVFDMPLSGPDDAIETSARAWAESAWAAWSAHHNRIADWYVMYARS